MKRVLVLTILFVLIISGAVLGSKWTEKVSINTDLYYTSFNPKFFVEGVEVAGPWPNYVKTGLKRNLGLNLRCIYDINKRYSIGIGYDDIQSSYHKNSESGFSRLSGPEVFTKILIIPYFHFELSYIDYSYNFKAEDENNALSYEKIIGDGSGFKMELSYNIELVNNINSNFFVGYRTTDIILNEGDYQPDNNKLTLNGYLSGLGISYKF